MEYEFSHLICFSPTHSSHMIGETIMRGLFTEHSEETDLTYEGAAKPLCLDKTITVIVVPVYAGRIPDVALERMKMIRGQESPAIPVVVYGNRDYDDALLELKNWCIEHGFTPVAAAAFIGEHSYSRPDRPIAAHRPDENDLQIALKFGQEIQEHLRALKGVDLMKELEVKGNFPYKLKVPSTPQAPVNVKERCTQCGLCVEICPVQAISLNEEISSNPEVCIKCCACVKQCPGQAMIFDTPYTDMLFKNFSARREPEMFYAEL